MQSIMALDVTRSQSFSTVPQQQQSPYTDPIEMYYNQVHTGKLLGKGGYGSVRVVNRKEDCQDFACKHIVFPPNRVEHVRHYVIQEVKMLYRLDHPHIAKIEDVFLYEDEAFIIMELGHGGTLLSFLRSIWRDDEGLTEETVQGLATQMTSALEYMHSKGIVHRDMKLENMVFMEEDNVWSLNIIDFGFAEELSTGEKFNKQVGSLHTMAPEVLLKKPYDENVDMWAVGVVLYMLITRSPLFGSLAKTQREQTNFVVHGDIQFDHPVWGDFSIGAIEFVSSLLQRDARKRMSAAKALNHVWIRDA